MATKMNAVRTDTSAVHFHSGDDRFCGSRQIGREFTADENAVSCSACRGNDRLSITPYGLKMLRDLGYMTTRDIPR